MVTINRLALLGICAAAFLLTASASKSKPATTQAPEMSENRRNRLLKKVDLNKQVKELENRLKNRTDLLNTLQKDFKDLEISPEITCETIVDDMLTADPKETETTSSEAYSTTIVPEETTPDDAGTLDKTERRLKRQERRQEKRETLDYLRQSLKDLRATPFKIQQRLTTRNGKLTTPDDTISPTRVNSCADRLETLTVDDVSVVVSVLKDESAGTKKRRPTIRVTFKVPKETPPIFVDIAFPLTNASKTIGYKTEVHFDETEKGNNQKVQVFIAFCNIKKKQLISPHRFTVKACYNQEMTDMRRYRLDNRGTLDNQVKELQQRLKNRTKLIDNLQSEFIKLTAPEEISCATVSGETRKSDPEEAFEGTTTITPDEFVTDEPDDSTDLPERRLKRKTERQEKRETLDRLRQALKELRPRTFKIRHKLRPEVKKCPGSKVSFAAEEVNVIVSVLNENSDKQQRRVTLLVTFRVPNVRALKFVDVFFPVMNTSGAIEYKTVIEPNLSSENGHVVKLYVVFCNVKKKQLISPKKFSLLGCFLDDTELPPEKTKGEDKDKDEDKDQDKDKDDKDKDEEKDQDEETTEETTVIEKLKERLKHRRGRLQELRDELTQLTSSEELTCSTIVESTQIANPENSFEESTPDETNSTEEEIANGKLQTLKELRKSVFTIRQGLGASSVNECASSPEPLVLDDVGVIVPDDNSDSDDKPKVPATMIVTFRVPKGSLPNFVDISFPLTNTSSSVEYKTTVRFPENAQEAAISPEDEDLFQSSKAEDQIVQVYVAFCDVRRRQLVSPRKFNITGCFSAQETASTTFSEAPCPPGTCNARTGQVCMLDTAHSLATCACPQCSGYQGPPVCGQVGSDVSTYDNICLLRQQACNFNSSYAVLRSSDCEETPEGCGVVSNFARLRDSTGCESDGTQDIGLCSGSCSNTPGACCRPDRSYTRFHKTMATLTFNCGGAWNYTRQEEVIRACACVVEPQH